MSHAQLEAVRTDERLVWVTPAVAVNPANILLVFHGRGGQIDVHFVGQTRQLTEADLTEAGRALLLPPDRRGDTADSADDGF
jgi:hypothetical protein